MGISKAIFHPGVWVMRRVSLRLKLMVFAAAILIPVVGGSGWYARNKLAQAELTTTQTQGAKNILALLKLVELIQTHRGQNNMFANGNKAVEPELLKTRTSLKEQFSDVELALGEVSPDLKSAVAKLATDFNKLAADLRNLRASAAFKQHSDLIARAQGVIHLVVDAAQFYRAADPGVATTAGILGDRVVPWLESLGQARGFGAGLLARNAASTPELGRIKALEFSVAEAKLAFEQALSAAKGTGVQEPPGWGAAKRSTETFLATIAKEFAGELPDGDSKAYFAIGTDAIKGALKVSGEIGEDLSARLDALNERAENEALVTCVVAALGVLAISYILIAFYLSFSSSVHRLRKAMQAAAAGDLSYPIAIHGTDELAAIGKDLETTCHNLSILVARIRSDSTMVADTGASLAVSAEQLSQRTIEQSASIEESAATVHEISSTVKNNAGRASEVDSEARTMFAQANEGSQYMSHMVSKMQQINESSERVTDIVSVIDSIAFQTNILALNAAIEAARAGEAGRGFSVVAAEVRALAQKSAESAQAIRDLIAQSGAHVAEGVTQISTVHGMLNSLVKQARSVAEAMSHIAQSTNEQSDALNQMSIAVVSLEEITTRNASMVQDSTDATARLQEMAGNLKSSVGSVRLRQGTADEAMAMVERARDLLRSEGLAAVTRSFSDPEGGFIDRDLYVFVVDREGKFLSHGVHHSWVGKYLAQIYPEDGHSKLEAYKAAADKGGDWVRSISFDPISQLKRPKLTYVLPVTGQTMVACGVYDYTDDAIYEDAATSEATSVQ